MDIDPPDWQKAVVLHVTAYHIDRDTEHNENNLGLGVRLRPADRKLFWMVGFFRNSLDEYSVYAGGGLELWSHGPVALRVLFGGVSGYDSAVAPMIVPELAVGGNWRVAFSYIPQIDNQFGKVDQAITFSVIREF
jgi:hypothetical protein